jgi:hypothetical protein
VMFTLKVLRHHDVEYLKFDPVSAASITHWRHNTKWQSQRIYELRTNVAGSACILHAVYTATCHH